MNEWIISIGIWLLSTGYCIFSPGSSFGKKVIFCSWILGACKMVFAVLIRPSMPILGMFSGMTILGTLAAIVLAHIFGERIIDKLNPNSSRIAYIVIGFCSSVLLSALIPTLIF